MLKEITARFNKPTPPKYRKLGKAIAGLGVTLQLTIGGLQAAGQLTLSKNAYTWIVIVIALTAWLGQTVTDLATDDSAIELLQNNSNGQI